MAIKLDFSKVRSLLEQALPKVAQATIPPYGAYQAFRQIRTTPSLIPSKLPSIKEISKPLVSKITPITQKIGEIPMATTTEGFFATQPLRLTPKEEIVPLREFLTPRSYLGGKAGKAIASSIETALLANIPTMGRIAEAGKVGISKIGALKGALGMGGFTAALSALKGEKPTLKELAPQMALGAVFGGIQPIKKPLGRYPKVGEEVIAKFKPETTQGANLIKRFGEQAKVKILSEPKRFSTGMVAVQGEIEGKKVWLPISKHLEWYKPITEGIKPKISQEKIKIKAEEAPPEAPPPKTPPPETPPPSMSDEELIKRMTKAIKEAKPLRVAQEALYTKERGKRLAKILSIREKMAGKEGYIAELGALKGELPKVSFAPIEKEFTKENVNRLFDMINESEKIGVWEKVNAKVGLAKILEKGQVPTHSELRLLNEVFGKDFVKAILEKRSFWEKFGEALAQAWNLPKAMMTPLDFSATLMQNLVFAYRHPLTTLKNIPVAIKSMASETYYRQAMKEIGNRPTFKAMKEARVDFTDVGEQMTAREELFMTSWAEKIPGIGRIIKASNRSYSGFLNKMRADVFDQLYNAAKQIGEEKNPEFLKWAGKVVNAGTGRGDVSMFGRASWILSRGLFSSRKLAATAWWLNPINYVKAHPLVRKEMLKSALAVLGGGLTILGLAKLNGAEVNDDPTNIDFGRIKIGNTRFNIWGDFQRIAVLLTRLLKGYGTSSVTGRRFVLGQGYRPLTRADLIQSFFEGKLDPTLSFIIGLVRGQTQFGDPFRISVELAERIIPMVLSDIYDLYRTQDPAIATIGTVLTIFGLPAQTYGERIPEIKITPTGKQTIRLKEYPKLPELIINAITGTPITNVPKELWPTLVAQKEKENWKRYLNEAKNTITQQVREGEITPEQGEKQLQEIFQGAQKAGINPFSLLSTTKGKKIRFKTGGRRKVKAMTLKEVFGRVSQAAKLPKTTKTKKRTKTLREYLEKNRKIAKRITLGDIARIVSSKS